MNVQVLWRFSFENKCVWEHLDETHIVFHCVSGKTHFLNETSYLLLKTLEEKPATTLELARLAAERSGSEMTDNTVQQVENHLLRLDELGLIGKEHEEHRTPCKLANLT